jgi:hypothetical protein
LSFSVQKKLFRAFGAGAYSVLTVKLASGTLAFIWLQSTRVITAAGKQSVETTSAAEDHYIRELCFLGCVFGKRKVNQLVKFWPSQTPIKIRSTVNVLPLPHRPRRLVFGSKLPPLLPLLLLLLLLRSSVLIAQSRNLQETQRSIFVKQCGTAVADVSENPSCAWPNLRKVNNTISLPPQHVPGGMPRGVRVDRFLFWGKTRTYSVSLGARQAKFKYTNRSQFHWHDERNKFSVQLLLQTRTKKTSVCH